MLSRLLHFKKIVFRAMTYTINHFFVITLLLNNDIINYYKIIAKLVHFEKQSFCSIFVKELQFLTDGTLSRLLFCPLSSQ